jgi:hypothetical protein
MFDRICRKDLRRIANAVVCAGFLVWWVTARAAEGADKILVPQIDGGWWQIAGSPDVGKYTTAKQEPVDFAIWQAADGTWQLWSCIRETSYPNWTRLFYRWESPKLTDKNWKSVGIAMTSDPSVGEVEGLLQAPYVMKYKGEYLMFYGTGAHIALAKSRDGKIFKRRLLPDGKVNMFGDGLGTRDPMALLVNGVFNLYYSANPDSVFGKMAPETPYAKITEYAEKHQDEADPNYDLLRTSTDLVHWSPPKKVAFGGEAGKGDSSAECPFVYYHKQSGYYYLFRTQHYGQNSETRVYRSKDRTNFGIDDDRYLVTKLPIAAPEIIESNGQLYVAALLPSLKGIQIAKLNWVPKM